jgi:Tfp pilus assembly protein PilW
MRKKNLPLVGGFTLLEVLIYSAILAMFFLVTTQIFITIKNTNAHSLALVGLQKNLRQVSAEMTQTIRQATAVTSPLPGETSETLSLNEGAIVYGLSDGVLQKSEGGETWDLTTDEVTVSNLSFANLVEATQSGSLRITADVQANFVLEGGQLLSENFQTTISLR